MPMNENWQIATVLPTAQNFLHPTPVNAESLGLLRLGTFPTLPGLDKFATQSEGGSPYPAAVAFSLRYLAMHSCI